MSYTAREVQQALENFEWQEEYKHYKYAFEGGIYGRVKDAEGNDVVESEVVYTNEFSWAEAEESIGKVYDVLGGVKVVASDPGGEGHGEDIYCVVQTVDTGQVFRVDGYYASYGNGSVYQDHMYEVKITEKTITVYEERV